MSVPSCIIVRLSRPAANSRGAWQSRARYPVRDSRPVGCGSRAAPVKWVDKSQPDYWSGTEVIPGNNARNFNFDNGNQNNNNENNQFSAWAVRPG